MIKLSYCESLTATRTVIKTPGWLGYVRDYTTQLYTNYFISHEIRIPFFTNQYFMVHVT